MRPSIKEKLLSEITRGQGVRPGMLSTRFGVSRQAIHRHLNILEREGAIIRQGEGPLSQYVAADQASSYDVFCRDLRAIWSAHPQVKLVTLFGSVARETSGPNSDIDVLILFEDDSKIDRRVLWDYWDEKSKKLSWSDRVSIVPLRLTTQFSLHTLLLDLPEEHILVFERDGLFLRLKKAIISWRRRWGARKVPSFGASHAWEYTQKKLKLTEIDFTLRLDHVA